MTFETCDSILFIYICMCIYNLRLYLAFISPSFQNSQNKKAFCFAKASTPAAKHLCHNHPIHQYDTTQSAGTEIKPSHLEIGKVVFNSKRSDWKKGSGSVKNVIVWLKWLWGFVIFFILQSKGWTSSKGDSGLTANSWPSECNKPSQPMIQYSIVPLTCDDAECMNSPRT